MGALRVHLVGLLAGILILVSGCGGSTYDESSTRLELMSLSLVEPELSCICPTEFTFSVTRSGWTMPVECMVRFEAAGGAPFRGGTASEIEVPATIHPDGTVRGTAPCAVIRGQEEIYAKATLFVPGGPPTGSAERLARFKAPVVSGLDPAMCCVLRSPRELCASGENLQGPSGEPMAVTIHWTSPEPIFNGGTATTTATPAVVESDDAITGMTPEVVARDMPAATAKIERIEYEDGTWAHLTQEVPDLTYLAPTVEGIAPVVFPALMGQQKFGAIGQHTHARLDEEVPVKFRWSIWGGEFFDGGEIAETVGVVSKSGALWGETPHVIIRDGPAAIVSMVAVEFPQGNTSQLAADLPRLLFRAPELRQIARQEAEVTNPCDADDGEAGERKSRVECEALVPTMLDLRGSFLDMEAPTSPLATIHWKSDESVFEGGAQPETTTTATIASPCRLESLTPLVAACGMQQARASIEMVEFADGNRAYISRGPLSVDFLAPRLTAMSKTEFIVEQPVDIPTTGLRIDCEGIPRTPGLLVDLVWEALPMSADEEAKKIFVEDAPSATATTEGRVLVPTDASSPPYVEGVTPRVDLGGTGIQHAQLKAIRFSGGTCTTLESALPCRFNLAPILIELENKADNFYIPGHSSAYVLIVAGYQANEKFNQLHFYNFAKHMGERGAYVHYAWWNNLCKPYMEKKLSGPHTRDLFDDGVAERNRGDRKFRRDAARMLRAVKEARPDAPIIILGWSMGGHAVLKLAYDLERDYWHDGVHEDGFGVDLLAVVDPVCNEYDWFDRVVIDVPDWLDPIVDVIQEMIDALHGELGVGALIPTRFWACHRKVKYYWRVGMDPLKPRETRVPWAYSKVKYLYHVWQKETPVWPVDYKKNYEVDHTAPTDGGTHQEAWKPWDPNSSDPRPTHYVEGPTTGDVADFLVRPMADGESIYLWDFDGHAELVGNVGISIGDFDLDDLLDFGSGDLFDSTVIPTGLAYVASACGVRAIAGDDKSQWTSKPDWPTYDGDSVKEPWLETWGTGYYPEDAPVPTPQYPDLCRVADELIDIVENELKLGLKQLP